VLSQEISAAGALGSDWDALVVHFPVGRFVHCSAMAFLCTWTGLFLALREKFSKLRPIDAYPNVAKYLERLEQRPALQKASS
jgi:glutathione S-transferase